MTRRQFFQALSGGVVAGATVPFLPVSAPPLQFHRKAFALPFEASPAQVAFINRMDVVYGVGFFRENHGVRVLE